MDEKLKIFHWGCTGGVSFNIAHVIGDDFESKILIRSVNDPVGHRIAYPNNVIVKENRVRKYIFQTLYEIKKFKPDIVQVHGNFRFMRIILRARKLLGYKKIITHHHGTRIRNLKRVPKDIEKKSDRIIVSTPDLTYKPDYLYLTNPIDNKLFTPSLFKEKEVLHLRTNPIDYLEQVKIIMNKNPDYKLILLDKFDFHKGTKDHMKKYEERFRNIYPYLEMPNVLKSIQYVLDYKGYLVLSKTAFESLATGCIVINEQGDKIMPSQFDFDKINQNWKELYWNVEEFNDPYIDKYHTNLILNNQTREYFPNVELNVSL